MCLAIRNFLKKKFFDFLKKVMQSDIFREESLKIVEQQYHNRYLISSVTYRTSNTDYPELGIPESDIIHKRDDAIFITARFRSGSTFLWNIFKNIPNCTAYYEPLLHEKPEERGIGRQHKIDPTHRGVTDYHAEFKDIKGLSESHRSRWAFHQLYMDEFYFDPELEQYINLLIENAKGRPVLQFNRVDFRLQWLKSHYPNAKILHLYRHPREQWMSMIKNDKFIHKNFKWNQKNNDLFSGINAFYIGNWWKDLHFQMPFLKIEYLEHPYQIHYLIWRISYLYGLQFSNISIRYESLSDSFEQIMENCFNALDIKEYDMNKLSALINRRSLKTTWQDYADDNWFKMMETKSEQLLVSFFKAKGID